MENKDYWKIRSEGYNELQWVKEESYIDTMIKAGKFISNDLVLDVGTGTGIIAQSISPLVKEVIGIDISQEMMEHSNWMKNKYFVRRDIRDSLFFDEVFDKITARMVFHHITEDIEKAMQECHRILKKGGLMILSEGIPPLPELKQDYSDIFKLKENRITFLEEDIIKLMSSAGFKNIKVIPHVMNNFSVANWLGKSGLDKQKQDKIFEMHVTARDLFKKAYNMKIVNGDCLIDVKNIICVGEKC